ncbi:MAG: VanW family protein [Clostridia bacterium]|nr:VanW family protein [Clostridia bacterium]
MKKHKFFSHFLISSIVVIALSTSILAFSLLGLHNHNHDMVEDKFELSNNQDILLNEKIIDENDLSELNFVLNEKSYQFTENFSQNIKTMVEELYTPASNAEIVFEPDGEEVFVFKEERCGQEVDVNNLVKKIKNNVRHNENAPIEIPVLTIVPQIRKTDLEGLIELRSEFSTSISTSPENRKFNVKYALGAFNGLVISPDETVSFNQTIKEKTNAGKFKEAKIIVQGDFVSGIGGGMCQASTTLYNALLLADVEVVNVFNHSLPVSYVPRAFDAMVSDGFADLVFKNNSGYPLYIMTNGNNETVTVKVFGRPLEEGLEIKTKTEHIKNLPHKGDKIIPDSSGKYYDKICFKGEYLRLRYPKAGSEDIGYLLYYKNGEFISQKQIRHVYYPAQEGIIVEGVDELYEGMTLPNNEVKFINSQV